MGMTVAMGSQESPPIPLKFGPQSQFDSLRELLESSGYTSKYLCERLGVSSISELENLREGPMTLEGIEKVEDVLIWLFLGRERLDRAIAGRFLSDTDMEMLGDLGLIEDAPSTNEIQSTVLLYPVESVYIVSDLPINREDGSVVSYPDAVYPPFMASAGWFLSMMPRTPCESFLELCGGTGIAALLASQFATQSCSVDITRRSTIFAEFNAALNRTRGFRALEGDLYDPVSGETFDRIVAHPPYMPATENSQIFRDGGPDGEQITRGILRGLTDHLRPGGQLFVTAILSDRRDAPVEARVRDMLGSTAHEFDVAVVTIKGLHPIVHYGGELWKGTATANEVEPQLAHLRTLGIVRMVLCTVIVQRPAESRSVFTTRRVAGPQCDWGDLERMLCWEEGATDPNLMDWLATSAPRSTSTTELLVAHRLEDEGWHHSGLWLKTENPFENQVTCGSWVAEFLRRCDGKRSAMSVLESMKDDGSVPMDAPVDEFIEMVRGLAVGGFLHFDDS
jgi:SAM-dependent methyltransferase